MAGEVYRIGEVLYHELLAVRSHFGLGNFPRPREIAIFNPREIP